MENRKAERFPVRLSATVKSLDADPELRACGSAAAMVENISSRGALLSSAASWEKEQRVAVVVSFAPAVVSPYRYDVNLEGRVVRAQAAPHAGLHWYAVEFAKLWDLVNWEECTTV